MKQIEQKIDTKAEKELHYRSTNDVIAGAMSVSPSKSKLPGQVVDL